MSLLENCDISDQLDEVECRAAFLADAIDSIAKTCGCSANDFADSLRSTVFRGMAFVAYDVELAVKNVNQKLKRAQE